MINKKHSGIIDGLKSINEAASFKTSLGFSVDYKVEADAIEARKKDVLNAVARMKNSAGFSTSSYSYDISKGRKPEDSIEKLKDTVRACKAGASRKDDLLMGGPYGMGYKHPELKQWEDEQWNKAQEEGIKIIYQAYKEAGK